MEQERGAMPLVIVMNAQLQVVWQGDKLLQGGLIMIYGDAWRWVEQQDKPTGELHIYVWG